MLLCDIRLLECIIKEGAVYILTKAFKSGSDLVDEKLLKALVTILDTPIANDEKQPIALVQFSSLDPLVHIEELFETPELQNYGEALIELYFSFTQQHPIPSNAQ